jgi:cytochrome c-type biogenesis protein CcmH/NrfG
MNTQRLYLIIGLILVAAVVVFILVPEDSGAPEQPTADQMPHNHPEVGGMEQGMGDGQPSASNVRGDFMTEYRRLKEKVAAQPASDTSDVLSFARMLLDAHQAANALPLLERYHKAAPKNVMVMLDLSLAYYDTQSVDKAESITKKALSIEPNNTTAMYNLGAIYAKTERKAEAKSMWQKLIAQSPESKDAQRAKELMSEL